MTEVLYCYSCGKHVKRGGGKCWYCSAPTQRTIRPARHCPFCDEEIGAKAIKCPHCGEFLDESKRPQAQQQAPSQVVYVIDKAIIQGEQPLALPGGSPVPANIAGRLSHQTLEAIRTNDPRLIDQAGVKALPAPAAAGDQEDYIDIVPEETGAGEVHSHALTRRENAVAQREDAQSAAESTLAGTITRALVRSTGSALSKMGHFAMEAFAGSDHEEEKKPTEEDRYRVCNICSTEVLSTDNYCFHCGVVLRTTPKAKVELRDIGPSNFGLFVSCLVLMACFVFLSRSKILGSFGEGPVAYLAPGMAVLTAILIIGSFFRRRTTWNQIVSIVFFLIWVCATAYAFFLQ